MVAIIGIGERSRPGDSKAITCYNILMLDSSNFINSYPGSYPCLDPGQYPLPQSGGSIIPGTPLISNQGQPLLDVHRPIQG